MLQHSVCHNTLYVTTLCMLQHSVCYNTLYVTTLCMLQHSVCYKYKCNTITVESLKNWITRATAEF